MAVGRRGERGGLSNGSGPPRQASRGPRLRPATELAGLAATSLDTARPRRVTGCTLRTLRKVEGISEVAPVRSSPDDRGAGARELPDVGRAGAPLTRRERGLGRTRDHCTPFGHSPTAVFVAPPCCVTRARSFTM